VTCGCHATPFGWSFCWRHRIVDVVVRALLPLRMKLERVWCRVFGHRSKTLMAFGIPWGTYCRRCGLHGEVTAVPIEAVFRVPFKAGPPPDPKHFSTQSTKVPC
jgi:hypothetical protein